MLDREIKQVEFVRAANVPAKRIYVYDGFKVDERYRGWNYDSIRREASYGTESNPKVWVMLEFKNSESAHLGMPLPKGKVKVYRRDVDGRNEFIGEDQIDHTPKDETVRLYTGNAFDLVGERRQTNFKLDTNNHWADESFEIKVRNHKKEEVEVRVVEHLYRWFQWEITGQHDGLHQDRRAHRRVPPESSCRRSGHHQLHSALHVVTVTKYKWLAWSVAVALACGCAGVPRSGPATTSAPLYYQEALRAYWSGSNPIAFVLASLAVENDPDPRHVEHAGYLVDGVGLGETDRCRT